MLIMPSSRRQLFGRYQNRAAEDIPRCVSIAVRNLDCFSEYAPTDLDFMQSVLLYLGMDDYYSVVVSTYTLINYATWSPSIILSIGTFGLRSYASHVISAMCS